MKFFILNTSGAWGGIESHSIILAKALIRLGHEVMIGCREDSSTLANAQRHQIPFVPMKVANALDVKFVSKMATQLRENNIDVLIANIGKEYWPATVAAKLAGTKIVIYRHQLDPVKKITAWLMTNYVDHVIAVTDAVKTVLLDSGIVNSRIAVIYPGQEVDKFRQASVLRDQTREELGFSANQSVVAAAGKIHYGKGSFDLLEAIHLLSCKYPAVELMFIGDGEDRQNVESKAKELGIESHVHYTGFRHDIERFLAAIDVFALPSKTYESFGMVIIEAMAAGKPVIGTALGGIPEIITHEETGILVQPGNPAELASAIEILILNPLLREKLVRQADKKVEDLFTAEASARQLIELLNKN